jgi:DNA-binding NtrC family response regulator
MEKVAIVDDDLSLCHFLRRTLILKGYQVFAYHSGREALEGIKGDCDLVLLDNRMPDLTGLEVLKEMKKNFPKMPVIIMTAFGTTETAIEAMRLGAFDYILKPFELEEIFELINRGLEAGKLMKRAVAIPALAAAQEDSDQIIGK